MIARKVERVPRFETDVEKLESKHRGARKIIDDFLDERAKGAPLPRKDLMTKVGGRPIYKVRLPLPRMGKRQGARVIYYCDDSVIHALRVYDKSTIKEPTANDITQAIKAAGI